MGIEQLFDNNVNWALARSQHDPGFFPRLAGQQSPHYLWIGCSDSRVPANEIVGLDPGELFVHRNVANVMHTGDLNLLSVLEYAIEVLRVSHVIVCGHYGCGGVLRAMEGGGGALVDHWLAPIVDLYARESARFAALPDDRARGDLLCELNVDLQVSRVAATPIVKKAWREGRPLAIHGWVYGLNDGLLRDLGVSRTNAATTGTTTEDGSPVDDWSAQMHSRSIRVMGTSTLQKCTCGEDHEGSDGGKAQRAVEQVPESNRDR